MTRLIAYGRVCSRGLFSWSPKGATTTSWDDLDAGAPGEFEIPKLRARYFFNEAFPKYGRMDALCKVAVSAAQLAVKASGDLAGLERDEIAQVGGTMLGCLDIDARYDAGRRTGAASPAQFVYTLPSMFQGETSIRYGLRGRCALLSTGAMSGMTALATGIRWIATQRARHALVIAADTAGAAAQKFNKDYAPMSAASAWLLSATGDGRLLSNAYFNTDPRDSTVLTPGQLRYATTFADTLEPLLTGDFKGRVHAQLDGHGVGFQIE